MLRKEIEQAINRNSAENGSNTPDFILAEYLTDCLAAFDKAVKAREEWYGRRSSIVTGVEPEDIAPGDILQAARAHVTAPVV